MSRPTVFTELFALQTSSKERTPLLDHFYTDIWKGLSENPSSEPRTVIEYGCGINALAYPWMGRVKYAGYDVDHEVSDFMNSLLTLYDLQDCACTKIGDVLIDDLPPADVYLLLKLIPLLEHQEKNCTLPLLRRVPARDTIVSFPTRSISGRDKGMEAFYRKFFTELISGEGWEYSEMCFDNELVFVVKKG